MGTSAELEPGEDDGQDVRNEIRALTTEEARALDQTRRGERTARILNDADRRDDEATARDAVSDERERVADRLAFTDPGASYLSQSERRAAAFDRADAKTDRESSAEDRAQLAEGEDVASVGSPSSG